MNQRCCVSRYVLLKADWNKWVLRWFLTESSVWDERMEKGKIFQFVDVATQNERRCHRVPNWRTLTNNISSSSDRWSSCMLSRGTINTQNQECQCISNIKGHILLVLPNCLETGQQLNVFGVLLSLKKLTWYDTIQYIYVRSKADEMASII